MGLCNPNPGCQCSVSGVSGRTTRSGSGAPSDPITIDLDPEIGRGVVGYAAVTATQGSITTITDLTSLTVTFTATSTRRYKVTAVIHVSSSVDGDKARMTIATGGNSGLQIAGCDQLSSAATTIVGQVILTALSGSTTIKLRLARQSGSGNLTLQANSANPCYILVEDIGDDD